MFYKYIAGMTASEITSVVATVLVGTIAIITTVILFIIDNLCKKKREKEIFSRKKKATCTNIRYLTVLLMDDIENIKENILSLSRVSNFNGIKMTNATHWYQFFLNNKFYTLQKLHHHKQSFENLMLQVAEYDDKIFRQCIHANIYIFNSLYPSIEYLAQGLTSNISKTQFLESVGNYKQPALYATISESLILLSKLEKETKKYNLV